MISFLVVRSAKIYLIKKQINEISEKANYKKRRDSSI